MTYTVDWNEEDQAGSVELTRSDGKQIKGTYRVRGGKGSLRGGSWDNFANTTELDEETARRVLDFAHDLVMREGSGPFPWNDLALLAGND